MQQVILLIHVLVAIFLIVLVLIQHGKGADIGAAFGSGASNTIFGSQGSGTFLLKITCLLAGIFFATSLTLGYMSSQQAKDTNNTGIPLPPAQTAPVAPLTATIPTPTQNNSSNDNVAAPLGNSGTTDTTKPAQKPQQKSQQKPTTTE